VHRRRLLALSAATSAAADPLGGDDPPPRYDRLVPRFEVVSPLRPAGDQPRAIATLSRGVERGDRFQTLLGVTGSGKTATVAWLIEAVQRPTLVIEPNKSLAAQLASELRELFPKNRVEFFVSYYDYYQPEAYLPSSDTYIEKDSSINDEIDRLRHATTSSLLLRRDVIVVASVSCIYGLGSPEEYSSRILVLHPGDTVDQRGLLRRLVDLHYERNDSVLSRGRFRVRGDTVELHPAYEEQAVRIELFGDEVERIRTFDALTGEAGDELEELIVFSATHYVAGEETMRRAILDIEAELRERLEELQTAGKLLEAQRLRMRTEHDLEMLAEVGVVNGIENYSRHLDGRKAGEPPHTLLDFFPDDYLTVIDESHVAVPQIHGQFEGDRSRKLTLVEHGFRLPSALDNRPLTFEEFSKRTNQVVFLSATPAAYELEVSTQVAEQVIRPTGLVDPEVVLRPTTGQIDDLLDRIRACAERGGRVLVTTLTKKMAEDLTDYLLELGVRVRYLHSDIDTITRIELLRDLRLGEFDVLVGINLLREGLDLPEVQLVAILDADKTGFLRSASSLIQTMGRAARNVDGLVVLYADTVTDAMREAISETQRRRTIQQAYNKEHGIDPTTIRKSVTDILERLRPAGSTAGGTEGGRYPVRSKGSGRSTGAGPGRRGRRPDGLPVRPLSARTGSRRGSQPRAEDAEVDLADLAEASPSELEGLVRRLESEMRKAATELRYEEAALLRDEIAELRLALAEAQPVAAASAPLGIGR
jgi:excinuclease ABC subunit B